ncbi:MAG: DUF971 domain-containing protein [Caulobacterales bacterium]
MAQEQPWPRELVFSREHKSLRIAFDNDETYEIPFELLRIESPSAEERGHGPAHRTIGGKRNVAVTRADPVGRYAVRIVFDDGHQSGLYSWEYLRDLGRERDARMNAYLKRLDAAGLQRG